MREDPIRDDVVEHEHGPEHGLHTHTHAFGSFPHNHLLRAICHRLECIGYGGHNLHECPSDVSRRKQTDSIGGVLHNGGIL